MNNYFYISEFIIDPNMKRIPLHVADKIIQFHLPILNPIRDQLGIPVIISKRSGYRSVSWEKVKGRSGNSQHTFKGKGAADIRSNQKFDQLLELLIESDYTRVCYYPHHKFVHCDLKPLGKNVYFEADNNDIWQFQHFRD